VAKLTKAQWDKLIPIMGIWSDASIAQIYEVDRGLVGKERAKRGIAPYPQEEFLTPMRDATKLRGEGTRKDILACLWPTLPSTSSEVHERMERSHGTVSKRHVIRVLAELVKAGKVKQDPKGWETTYTLVTK